MGGGRVGEKKNKNNAILNSVEVKVEVGVELGKKSVIDVSLVTLHCNWLTSILQNLNILPIFICLARQTLNKQLEVCSSVQGVILQNILDLL